MLLTAGGLAPSLPSQPTTSAAPTPTYLYLASPYRVRLGVAGSASICTLRYSIRHLAHKTETGGAREREGAGSDNTGRIILIDGPIMAVIYHICMLTFKPTNGGSALEARPVCIAKLAAFYN